MSVIKFAFYATGFILTYFQFPSYIYFYAFLLLAYTLISLFFIKGKSISNSRKVMFHTWESPQQGLIQAKQYVNLQNVIKYLESYSEDKRPQLLHVVSKGLSEILRQSDDLNGKIVFGKFYKYKNVKISLKLQIQGQQTVTMIIQNSESKSIEDLRDEISNNINKHKKQTNSQTEISTKTPSFIFQLRERLIKYLTSTLSLSLPFFNIKKDRYGTCIISYNQRIDSTDLTMPFYGFADCPIQLTFTKAHQRVIVKDGKPTIATVTTVNFIVDHRFLDGAKAKNLIPNFMKVFDKPEEFSGRKKVEVGGDGEKDKLI